MSHDTEERASDHIVTVIHTDMDEIGPEGVVEDQYWWSRADGVVVKHDGTPVHLTGMPFGHYFLYCRCSCGETIQPLKPGIGTWTSVKRHITKNVADAGVGERR